MSIEIFLIYYMSIEIFLYKTFCIYCIIVLEKLIKKLHRLILCVIFSNFYCFKNYNIFEKKDNFASMYVYTNVA